MWLQTYLNSFTIVLLRLSEDIRDMYYELTLPILQYIEIVCAQLKLSRTLSYNTFIQNKSIPPFYYNPSLIVDRFNPLRLYIIKESKFVLETTRLKLS